MKKYTFNKENHFALIKAGYQIQKEGFNSDGDVVVVYYNERTFTRMGLVRPDDPSYTGIVAKWEAAEADIAFEKAIGEYFAKELAKPQPQVCYLPSAQRAAEGLVGPLLQ